LLRDVAASGFTDECQITVAPNPNIFTRRGQVATEVRDEKIEELKTYEKILLCENQIEESHKYRNMIDLILSTTESLK
jgi:hypothetical protein